MFISFLDFPILKVESMAIVGILSIKYFQTYPLRNYLQFINSHN